MSEIKKRIRNIFLKRTKNEEGASMIIVAMGITAFLSFLALVVDLGFAYYNRSVLQASCDAAALAAANYLKDEDISINDPIAKNEGLICFKHNIVKNFGEDTDDPVEINTRYDEIANRYNLLNAEDLDLHYKIIREAGKKTKIKVSASMESPTGFAQIFGVSKVDVGTAAAAIGFYGPMDSIWDYAVFSNENMSVSGGNKVIKGGLGSNGNVELGGNITDASEIATHGTLGGYNPPNPLPSPPPVIVTGAPEYPFGNQCDWYESYLKSSESGRIWSNPSDIPSENHRTSSAPSWMDAYTTSPDWDKVSYHHERKRLISYDTDANGNAINKVYQTDVFTEAYKLNKSVCYDCNINIGAAVPLVIPSGTTLYVTGNATFAKLLIIEEGAKVIVGGLDCMINEGLCCDGHLLVTNEGSMLNVGVDMRSTSESFSHIFFHGNRGITLGQAGTNMHNVYVVAPHCSQFNINGGENEIRGCVIANVISSFGSKGFNVEYPGDDLPWVKKANQIRLVE